MTMNELCCLIAGMFIGASCIFIGIGLAGGV